MKVSGLINPITIWQTSFGGYQLVHWSGVNKG